MADEAWTAARDRFAVARARCLEALAESLRRTPTTLDKAVVDAVTALGHEAFQIGVDYVHGRATVPPAAGSYRVQPGEVTRVDGLHARKRRP